MEYITLINGVKVPMIGLGTYPMKGETIKSVVKNCIGMGYELFDSAWYYRNETDIAATWRDMGIKRADVFISTKLKAEQVFGRRRYFHLDKATPRKCFENTLKRYGTDYIDLYLMHSYIDWYMEVYSELLALYEEGKIRAIGACSCTIEQLERFKAMHGVYPMVNQIEMHPYYNRRKLVEYCKEHDIQIMAFSPFAHGDYLRELIKNEDLNAIAMEYGKTVGQVILRWFIQQGVVVIPQSANPIHLKENIDIFDFELTNAEMDVIYNLEKNLSYGSFSKTRERSFMGIPLDH